MNVWHWLESLSPHQLDALRTAASCVGFGIVPVLTFLVGWAVKLLRALRHEAQQTAQHTAWEEHVDGELRTVSVADLAHRASEESRSARFASEASEKRTADLQDWVKGAGRRRLDTVDIPRVPAEESLYE